MPDLPSTTPARRSPGGGFATPDLVVGAVAVMLAAHVVLRVWMLWPSWFYGDDLTLLGQAGTVSPTEPYAGQFMPWGRVLAGVVADAGPLDWHAAALTTVVMVALADAACVWMLLEAFGRRWGVLLPLTAYLTTAVVMPATMWWAAALNQLPLQAVLCASVAAWLRHLRTGRTRWCVVVGVLLACGALAYVKVLLVLPVLGWLTLAHFCDGGAVHRLRVTVRDRGRALGALLVGAIAFVSWYLLAVPSITAADRSAEVAVDLAGSMLGRALPVGLLGGPWRWGALNRPVAPADPPDWAVAGAWVVLVAVGVLLAVRRRRTGRVWGLLALCAGGSYLLLLTTRSPLVGGVIGLEYRYLTDLAPVAALCLGLLTMTLRGAVEPTEPRDTDPERAEGRSAARIRTVAPVLGVALAVSGLVSSVGYARIWHDDHPARAWFDRARSTLAAAGTVDLADATAPPDVVSALVTPWNVLSRVLPLAGVEVSFPPVSPRVGVLDATGALRAGVVSTQVRGRPGPEPGCGYRLQGGADGTGETVTVPLEDVVAPGTSWLRVGYLSASATTVTVGAGGVSGPAQVSKGLGSIFVDVADGADAVTVTAGDDTLCIGDLEVGPLVAGGPW